MTSNIKVPLGKKDGLLRYWWENAINQELNISKAVVAALEYYMLTGDFIILGTLDIKAKSYDNAVVKWVYVSEESIVYNWLNNRQKNGEKISTIIKYVLRNSIKYGDQIHLSVNDELYKELERVRNNHHAMPSATSSQMPARYENVIEQEPIKPAEKDTMSQPHEIEEETSSSSDETSLNIFDQLIGNKGLSFGE